MEKNSETNYNLEEERKLSKRLRVSCARGKILLEQGIFTEEQYKKLIDRVLVEEGERRRIVEALKNGSSTVSEISQTLGLKPKIIVLHLVALIKNRIVAISGENEEEYIYKLIG
ncbi:MAG: ArsR family transcriptional regulator [Candidatus Helarchaeota archaeon]